MFLPSNDSGLRAKSRLHRQQRQNKSRIYVVNRQDAVRLQVSSQQQTKPRDHAGRQKSKNRRKNRKANLRQDIRQDSWTTMARRHNRQSVRKQQLKGRYT